MTSPASTGGSGPLFEAQVAAAYLLSMLLEVDADGESDDYGESWGLLFDAGRDTRVNGIAFDERRTQPWKEGWIDTDIDFGMATNRV
jgi:hypothetical protein